VSRRQVKLNKAKKKVEKAKIKFAAVSPILRPAVPPASTPPPAHLPEQQQTVIKKS
jgi:hypothetical protein